MIICRINPDDGISEYCTNLSGDNGEFPYYIAVFDSWIYVAGSTLSPTWKGSSTTYGSFLVRFPNTLIHDTCGELNIVPTTGVSWTDDAVPVRSVTLADVGVTTATLFSTNTQVATTEPAHTLLYICVFLDKPPVPSVTAQ